MFNKREVSKGITERMQRLQAQYEEVENDTTLTEEERQIKLDRITDAMIIADMEADERLYHRESTWEEDRRY